MPVVKCEHWHFGALEHDHGRREFIGTIIDKSTYADLYARLPSSFTLIQGNVILAIGGIAPMWPGVGEVWMMRSRHLEKHGLTVAREVRRGLELYGKGYWRLQASCAADDELCKRWLKWLGFEFEAHLKMFGPDKSDFEQYRRLKWK